MWRDSLYVTGLARGWVNGTRARHGLRLRGPKRTNAGSALLVFHALEDSAATGPRIEVLYSGTASVEEPVGGR